MDQPYYYNSHRPAPNSFNDIMKKLRSIIANIDEDTPVGYEYQEFEYDVPNEGHRIYDVVCLSVYMKQIQNSNVETQLRGVTKIHEMLNKTTFRCTRYNVSNNDSSYDYHNGNNKYYQSSYIDHKWLSEARLAQYLVNKNLYKIISTRCSYKNITKIITNHSISC